MVFICNLENNVYTLSNSTLNQGSNRASEIVLLAPYSRASLVYLCVTPPDGIEHEPLPMERAELPSDLPEEISNNFSAWKVDTPAALTTFSGTITFQFSIVNGAEKITTSTVNKTVNKGVSYTVPDVSTDNWTR